MTDDHAQAEEYALAGMCEAWDDHDREAASAYWRRFVRLHYGVERVAEMERRLGLVHSAAVPQRECANERGVER